jgi:metal-responsive CopG/Arc/MetJ family transcriptional regulator
LSDLTLWDSDLIRKKLQENFLNEEDKRIEEECDQERYAELYRDIQKETLQQEEELKRINADKNAYNQVGFTYDDSKELSSKTTEEVPQALDDDEYEPFYPSEKL